MITLNVQRSKQIKFGVEISGVQMQDLRGAVRLVHENVEYGFPIKILDDKISVEIPPLEDVIISELKDNQHISAKLEVIAGDVYLTPWSDTFKIEKPIKVEATIQQAEEVEEKIKPDIKAMILTELDIKPVKKKVEEKKVKPKSTKPKSKFSKMLESK